MRCVACVLALNALLLQGCSDEKVPAPELLEGELGVDLQRVTFEEWNQALDSLEGRIVVVDFWATWCAPCIERFPHMVELSRDFPAHDVEFVSMCLDDYEDEIAVGRAHRFLVELEPAFTNYLMQENVIDAFEKLDILGIPAVFIYGRDGRLRYRLTGDDPNNQFTEEDVEAAVRALLLEK